MSYQEQVGSDVVIPIVVDENGHQRAVPSPLRTVVEVRQTVSALRTTLVLAAVGAVGLSVLGLYWWLFRAKGGPGWGFGSGKGISSIFGQGGDPSPGGPGGASATPGSGDADGGGAPDAGNGETSSKPPSEGGGGQTAPQKPGQGQKDNPGGGKGGSGSQGAGAGGSGGGGGGVGQGSGGSGVGVGEGSSGDDDKGGSVGEDEGGGEDKGRYEGGEEGIMVEVDLPPPNLTEEKLAKIRTDIEDLVLGAVLDPGVSDPNLPPMLHNFDPGLGSVWKFWADVAFHHNFPEVPWGRLDDENPTHVPWIELWLDMYRYVLVVEIGENPGTEVEASVRLARARDREPDPVRRLMWTSRACAPCRRRDPLAELLGLSKKVRLRLPRHWAVNFGRTRS